MNRKTLESQRGGKTVHGAGWGVGVAALVAFAIGCGPAGEASTQEAEETLAHTSNPLQVDNGVALNRLNLNGLSLNGLSLNGLSLNGLATTDFRLWFQDDAALHNDVMKYLIACAVPAGETRTYTDSSTNIAYTWNGGLGLAPNWSTGASATVEEQQVVSACMAAHGNKFGVHVSISVQGRDAAGNAVVSTSQELSDYNVREGCFFGNLFDGRTGVFSGNDGLALGSAQSTPRVCGLPGALNSSQCDPITYVGSCSAYCVQDATHTSYTSCTYGGVTYRPLNTRMKPQDVFSCGDGVCQLTERCGSGNTPTGCAADCGTCH